MTRVLYPGSFDPVHNGHIEIITTASELFDEVVVAAMRNPQKGGGSFSLDEREEMIQESVGHLGNVSITMFSSLVVDLAKEIEADFIIKGLRRLGLRERTPDGADEQRRLRSAHPLHPVGVQIVVPRIEVHSRDRQVRWRCVVDGAGGGQPSDQGTFRVSGEQGALPPEYRSPQAEAPFRQAIELIEQARPMPLSASSMISKDEVLAVLQAAAQALPEELRAARWLLKERQDFLARSRPRAIRSSPPRVRRLSRWCSARSW